MPGDVAILLRIVWPYLAGASALGLGCGMFAWSTRPIGSIGRFAVGLAAASLVAGLAAAVLAAVPGRAGLALDLALALSVAFALGGLGGYGIRRLVARPASTDWS